MAKRDHYLALDLKRSTRTRFYENNNGYVIYTHTIPNISGTHLVLWNVNDWTAYPSLEDARAATHVGN